jgi:hypothetical protein
MRVGLAAASGSVNIEQDSRSKRLVSSFGVRTSCFALSSNTARNIRRQKRYFSPRSRSNSLHNEITELNQHTLAFSLADASYLHKAGLKHSGRNEGVHRRAVMSTHHDVRGIPTRDRGQQGIGHQAGGIERETR